MNTPNSLRTITVAPEAVDTMRDALIDELRQQAEALSDRIADYMSGSRVGMADARIAGRRVAQLVDVLDQLDADGWLSPLTELP